MPSRRRAAPILTTDLPFVITHVQFADPEDVPRFGQLHVIAALQLLWAVADPSTNELVKPYIDPAIYRSMYPARSILDTGGVIAGASDWPVSTRQSLRGDLPGGNALRVAGRARCRPSACRARPCCMPTRATPPQVLGQSKEIGTIAPGKRADLVLLDRDVLTVPPRK